MLDDGNQSIEIWDAETGRRTGSLLGGRGESTDLCVHPSSNDLIVTGTQTRAWDFRGPLPRWSFEQGRGESFSFWRGSDEVFASTNGGADFGLKRLPNDLVDIWSPPKSTRYVTEVSSDGRVAALSNAGFSYEVLLYQRVGTSIEPLKVIDTGQWCFRMRLSPSAASLVVLERARESAATKVFDIASGTERIQLDLTDVKRVSDMRWIGEDRLLGLVTVYAGRGNPEAEERVVLWDAATGTALRSVVYGETMNALAVSPDGRRFAEGGGDKSVRIRDAETLAVLREFRAHNDAIVQLAWHPVEPLLLTASDDLTVKLFDLTTEQTVAQLGGMRLPATELEFSPMGKRFAAHTDGAARVSPVRIWEVDEILPPPSAPDEHQAYTLGVARYRQGDWKLAVEALQDSVKRHQDYPLRWLYLAMSYKQLGESGRALDAYKQAASLLPSTGLSDQAKELLDEARELLALGRDELEQLLVSNPDDSGLAAELADVLLESNAAKWTVLKPSEMSSQGGATLTLLDDGSILASGKNPDQDVYSISAEVPLERITAIRLEAIPDPSLPKNGPGRFESNGNFHLSEFQVFSGDLLMKLTNVVVQFAELNQQRLMIDGQIDKQVGWSNAMRSGEMNRAVIDTNSAELSGDHLKFQLHFSRGPHPQHNLGRFRLSVTDAPDAYSYVGSQIAAKNQTDPWAKLALAYQVNGEEQQYLRLLGEHPESARPIVDLLVSKGESERALELCNILINDEANSAWLYAARATASVALENWEHARADWTRAFELDPTSEVAALGLVELMLTTGETSIGWTTVIPKEMNSKGGATLTRLEDGSILVSGENPDQDVYEIIADIDGPGPLALRLESVRHSTLPRGGFGRSHNGNVCLSELTVDVAGPGDSPDWQPIKFGESTTNVDDDYASQRSTGQAIDGRDNTWWAAHHTANPNLNPEAVFHATEPISVEGNGTIRVRLTFASPYDNHAFGRFRLSVCRDPSMFSHQLLLRSALASLGDNEVALADLITARTAVAFKMSEQGQIQEALREFRMLIDLNPKNAGPFNGAAWIMATVPDEEGRYPEVQQAVKWARRANELLPDNGNQETTLGAALYRDGQWQEAIDTLQKSIEHDYDRPHSWLFIAMAHWQLGQKDEARQWYEKALGWQRKGFDRELQGFYFEAARLMITLLEETPSEQITDANWLANRGEAYVATEKWERARADFDRAIQLAPGRVTQAFLAYGRAERWSEAADFGFPFIDAHRENRFQLPVVAAAFVLSGNHKDYGTYCRQAEERFGQISGARASEMMTKSALLLPGSIDVDKLPTNAFIESLESGTTSAGLQPSFWTTRALLALRTEDAEAAVEYVSRSEDCQPGEITRALSLSILSLAQHQQGNTAAATSALEQASLILGKLKQTRAGITLTDLAIAEILNREAKATIAQ